MQTLCIATRNAHKTGEFKALLHGLYEVIDLRDLDGMPPVEENGTTFVENAALKAVAASKWLGAEGLVLADDSGIAVDALRGEPGIYSARYAGPAATDRENLELLLHRLRGVANRRARFHCAIVIAQNGEVLASFERTCEGYLLEAPSGEGGFGYDPIFVPEGEKETFSQLPPETKNRLSHRGKALEAALKWLQAR